MGVVADLLAEEEPQLRVVGEPLQIAQPDQSAHIDVRDHLGDRPSAVAVGAVQVTVADGAEPAFQSVEGGVQVGGYVDG